MINNFSINYDNQTLELKYNGQIFMWAYTRTQGDLGDFWNSFVTNDSMVWDINLYQEEATDEPLLSVYPCKKDEDGNYEIDTSQCESIPCLFTQGDVVKFYEEYYK
jgi:hypothetical protein